MELTMNKAVDEERKQRVSLSKGAERELQEERKIRRRLEKQLAERAIADKKAGMKGGADSFASVRSGIPLDLKRTADKAGTRKASLTRERYATHAELSPHTPEPGGSLMALQSQLREEQQKRQVLVEQQRKE